MLDCVVRCLQGNPVSSLHWYGVYAICHSAYRSPLGHGRRTTVGCAVLRFRCANVLSVECDGHALAAILDFIRLAFCWLKRELTCMWPRAAIIMPFLLTATPREVYFPAPFDPLKVNGSVQPGCVNVALAQSFEQHTCDGAKDYLRLTSNLAVEIFDIHLEIHLGTVRPVVYDFSLEEHVVVWPNVKPAVGLSTGCLGRSASSESRGACEP